MERMQILVKALEVEPAATRAVVHAVSAKRHSGAPEVQMRIDVVVPTVVSESRAALRTRVRDVVLAYLDPE